MADSVEVQDEPRQESRFVRWFHTGVNIVGFGLLIAIIIGIIMAFVQHGFVGGFTAIVASLFLLIWMGKMLDLISMMGRD